MKLYLNKWNLEFHERDGWNESILKACLARGEVERIDSITRPIFWRLKRQPGMVSYFDETKLMEFATEIVGASNIKDAITYYGSEGVFEYGQSH